MADSQYRSLSWFKKLEGDEKAKVEHHLKLAGGIHMWWNIGDYLIKEVHDKKSVKRKRSGQTKYIPSDSAVDELYRYYLFHGNRTMNTMTSSFPSAFKCYLEDLMYSQVSESTKKEFEGTQVYYNHQNKPKDLQFSDFNSDMWTLSDGLSMTPEDLIVMEAYRLGFLSFMNDCIRELKEGDIQGFKKCKRAREQIARAMNKVDVDSIRKSIDAN